MFTPVSVLVYYLLDGNSGSLNFEVNSRDTLTSSQFAIVEPSSSIPNQSGTQIQANFAWTSSENAGLVLGPFNGSESLCFTIQSVGGLDDGCRFVVVDSGAPQGWKVETVLSGSELQATSEICFSQKSSFGAGLPSY